MLGFDTDLKYTLRINSDLIIGESLNITLFDSNKSNIPITDKTEYEYIYDCPKGIYTLRVEINNVFNDTFIELDGNKEYYISNNDYGRQNVIPVPLHYSSAPLGYDNLNPYYTSHEYYTFDAMEFSQRDTTELESSMLSTYTSSSLFIFLRFPSIEQYHEFKKFYPDMFIENFKLLDLKNNVIAEFNDPNIYHYQGQNPNIFAGYNNRGCYNNDVGSFAINLTLPEGTYYLLYEGSEPRQCVLPVFGGLHTQVFILFGKSPLFGSMRIFLSKLRLFEPSNEANILIDTLVDKLQNREYSIDPNLIKKIEQNAFDSPILSFLSLYLYFQSDQHDANEFIYFLMLNLNQYFDPGKEIADYRILEILYNRKMDAYNLKRTPFLDPPFFRIGYEILLKESYSAEYLIESNSMNDLISENILYDSPFTSFLPIRKKKPSTIKSFLKNIIDFGDEDPFSIFPSSSIPEDLNPNEESSMEPYLIDDFDIDLKEVLSKNFIQKIFDENTQTNWVRVSISDYFSTDRIVNINMLSREMGLPGNTIKRILQEWSKE